MKEITIVFFTCVLCASGQRTAHTANGATVTLSDDSTWSLVEVGEETFDKDVVAIYPLAVTEDSQLVLLREKMWESISPEDTVDVTFERIKMPTLPYAMVDEKPVLRYIVQPVYPWNALMKSQQGTVVIKMLVDTNGEVKSLDILESSGYMELDQAAIKVAWKVRFLPAKHKGHPVRVYVSMPYRFYFTEE
jgi:TonB family protein